MSLSNLLPQILEARFVVENGGAGNTIDILIQNESIEIVPVYWNQTKDVALSGNKRSNIRDLDLRITLDYGASLEPDKVEELFDRIVNMSGNDEIRFYPDANGVDHIKVIPSDGLSMIIEYDNTVRKGGSSGVIPTLSFEAESYQSSIDDFFN